jgi:hypothetical protein
MISCSRRKPHQENLFIHCFCLSRLLQYGRQYHFKRAHQTLFAIHPSSFTVQAVPFGSAFPHNLCSNGFLLPNKKQPRFQRFTNLNSTEEITVPDTIHLLPFIWEGEKQLYYRQLREGCSIC